MLRSLCRYRLQVYRTIVPMAGVKRKNGTSFVYYLTCLWVQGYQTSPIRPSDGRPKGPTENKLLMEQIMTQ